MDMVDRPKPCWPQSTRQTDGGKMFMSPNTFYVHKFYCWTLKNTLSIGSLLEQLLHFVFCSSDSSWLKNNSAPVRSIVKCLTCVTLEVCLAFSSSSFIGIQMQRWELPPFLTVHESQPQQHEWHSFIHTSMHPSNPVYVTSPAFHCNAITLLAIWGQQS